MKVSKLFYALTLNLQAYITTTNHLSFCLVIMNSHNVDLRNGDSLGLDAGNTFDDLGLDSEFDDGLIWDNNEVEDAAGGRAPEPMRERFRPYHERLIFADGNVRGDRHVYPEVLAILMQMFPFCCTEFGDEEPNLPALLSIVQDKANYEIISVEHIQNDVRKSMRGHFELCYGVTTNRVVYHGTSRASAESISKTGFRGAVCQRAKFGKGIYTSSSVWEALAYAEPSEKDWTQTVLIVNLAEGPKSTGTDGQVDFGTDEYGNEILTLTNPEGTIFCASREDQLHVMYRISVRHLTGRKHTPAHHNLVRIYHPTIWNRIKGQTAPAVPPPVFSVPPAAGAGGAPSATAGAGVERPTKHAVTTGTEIPTDSGFRKGDKVKLTGMPQKFTVLNGQEGEITMIVHLGRFSRILVELDNANDDLAKKFNDTRGIILSPSLNVKEHWLICLKQYLIHIYPPAPVNQTGESSSSVLGKRPAT